MARICVQMVQNFCLNGSIWIKLCPMLYPFPINCLISAPSLTISPHCLFYRIPLSITSPPSFIADHMKLLWQDSSSFLGLPSSSFFQVMFQDYPHVFIQVTLKVGKRKWEIRNGKWGNKRKAHCLSTGKLVTFWYCSHQMWWEKSMFIHVLIGDHLCLTVGTTGALLYSLASILVAC